MGDMNSSELVYGISTATDASGLVGNVMSEAMVPCETLRG